MNSATEREGTQQLIMGRLSFKGWFYGTSFFTLSSRSASILSSPVDLLIFLKTLTGQRIAMIISLH